MIMRIAKAVAAGLICCLLFSASSCEERNDERNAELDRNLCKEYGHGRKTKESTMWRQVCADGAVYEWQLRKFKEAWYRVEDGKKQK